LASLLAGLVLFVWGFVSHALLPWYDPAFSAFTDEAAVAAALERTVPSKGLYYLPFDEGDRGSGQLEAFVNVVPPGTSAGIGRQLAVGLLVSVVSAFLVLTLVRRTRPTTYREAVAAFSLAGLVIGFVSHAYYWNWFQFPDWYTAVTILDTLVGWTLAGAVLGRFLSGRKERA
jgi:hypothetical protein